MFANRTLLLAVLISGGWSLSASAQTIVTTVPYTPPRHDRVSAQAKIAGPVEVTTQDGRKVTLTNVRLDVTDWDDAERMGFTADEAQSLLPIWVGDYYGRDAAVAGKKPIVTVFYPICGVARISFHTTRNPSGQIAGTTVTITPRDGSAPVISGVHWGSSVSPSIEGKEDNRGFGMADFSIDSVNVKDVRLPACSVVPIRAKSDRRAKVVDVAGNEHLLSDVRFGNSALAFRTESGADLPVNVASIQRIAFSGVAFSKNESATVRLGTGQERTFGFCRCTAGIGGWDGRHFVFIQFDVISELSLLNPETTLK